MIKKIVPWLGVIITLLLLAALMAPRMTGQSSTSQTTQPAQFAHIPQWDSFIRGPGGDALFRAAAGDRGLLAGA